MALGNRAPRARLSVSAVTEAEAVLTEANVPLHYEEITSRVLSRGTWTTASKDPANTLNAFLSQHIKAKGVAARFQRAGRGLIALTTWNQTASGDNEGGGADLPEETPDPTTVPGKTSVVDIGAGRSNVNAEGMVSFADAAERVLDEVASKRPMHYRTITQKAIELGLVRTEGRTPEAALYVGMRNDIDRASKRGETPRFVKVGRGWFALSRWNRPGLSYDIEEHNAAVRRKLHAHLLGMAPSEFEALIGRLLAALGFEEVSVTDYSGDGGIDVRGTLVVGEVIRTRMAVQVKRWKTNVQAPIVQQVRGSLGAHEQGLIITTSDFSAGARSEAELPDRDPVALMNGEQVVGLLVEHDLGVRRTSHYLIELGEDEDEGA